VLVTPARRGKAAGRLAGGGLVGGTCTMGCCFVGGSGGGVLTGVAMRFLLLVLLLEGVVTTIPPAEGVVLVFPGVAGSVATRGGVVMVVRGVVLPAIKIFIGCSGDAALPRVGVCIMEDEVMEILSELPDGVGSIKTVSKGFCGSTTAGMGEDGTEALLSATDADTLEASPEVTDELMLLDDF